MLEGLDRDGEEEDEGRIYVFYLFYADEQKVYYSLPMRLQRSFSLLELYKMDIGKNRGFMLKEHIFMLKSIVGSDCKIAASLFSCYYMMSFVLFNLILHFSY